MGQARGSVVFDGELPGPMLPAVAGFWRLEKVSALRPSFCRSTGCSSCTDGQLMGGLGFDTLGGRRSNRTLPHRLDCGGRRGGQGGMGGSRLGGHAHHLLLLEIILEKHVNDKLTFILIHLSNWKKIQWVATLG